MANKYLKFEYWNSCDLGNIYYQGGQHFWFYLDGDVLEPFHEDTEDGQEDGEGDFIPTYRRQIKRYRIRTALVPDYLIDAIQRMKLHDNIELTFKSGEVEQIYNVDVEVEWQFEKYCWQGTVVMTFDMDEKVVLGTCCDNLTVGEVVPPEPIPDLYWVSEVGSDESGDGSYENPWKTLSYACTQATVSGDVIHVKAGTITETTQIILAVGVSIVGAGATSIIKSTFTSISDWDAALQLESAVEGTDGDQSISYLKFDGDSITGKSAISVYARSNVKIHHLTIEDFSDMGVIFHGGAAYPPTTLATGNEIYNCTITNSAGRGGSINVSGNDGILIHDNTMTNYQRALGHDPCSVCMTTGYNEDIRFYNNVMTHDRVIYDTDGTTLLWNIMFEAWDCLGGYQVYDNEFYGGHVCLDVAGTFNDKNAYDYSWFIHNNYFEWSAQMPTQIDGSFAAIGFEGGVEYLRIYANHVKNMPVGINSSILQADRIFEYIYIYYNIFENMGWGNDTWGFGMWIGQGHATAISRYIYIFNNVIDSGTGAEGSITGGIVLESTDTVQYVTIWNNVIQNVTNYGCICFWDWAGGHTIDNINISHNVWYNNVSANDFYYYGTAAVTNLTDADNTESDPLFVSTSDFHLQGGSPCSDHGNDMGLPFVTADFEGTLIDSTIEAGAYEE